MEQTELLAQALALSKIFDRTKRPFSGVEAATLFSPVEGLAQTALVRRQTLHTTAVPSTRTVLLPVARTAYYSGGLRTGSKLVRRRLGNRQLRLFDLHLVSVRACIRKDFMEHPGRTLV